jgi:mono/diheme cytochrome c family protein
MTLRPIHALLAAALRNGRGRAAFAALALGLTALVPAATHAAKPAAPTVDLSALPGLDGMPREDNPYRGNAQAIDLGRQVYAQACARCHGTAATEPGPAANLRLVGLYCRRLTDAELARRCSRDADEYFRTSVLKGKSRLGVEHMPPWEGVLSEEAIWAVRSFVEAQRGAKP